MPKNKGKFIVIDGTDGSGKATQVKLLVNRLKKSGKKVKTIDFPRYYNNFFGKFIGECLAGRHGDFLAMSPYVASVFYAADRFESANQIKRWLDQGYLVIADRYASSNQIHQGGKVFDKKERENFLEWLEKMEYKVFKIPKPDYIIYLSVPVEITQELLRGKNKKYLHGKKDLHENSKDHLEAAKKSALDLIGRFNNWKQIDCVQNGQIMNKKKINDLIWEAIRKI